MSGRRGAARAPTRRLASMLAAGCIVAASAHTGAAGAAPAEPAKLPRPPGARAASPTVSGHTCDWPMWGRDARRTFAGACPGGLTPESAPALRRIWFFRTRDVVTATPAVVGGTVYVGDWSGRFFALDRRDGRPRWTFDVRRERNVYAGQIVSSAAVVRVGGVRTVLFGAGKSLYALRASDGRLRWRFPVVRSNDPDAPGEVESSPVVVDGLAIVGWDVHNSRDGEPAGVVAVDARTGRLRWRAVTAPTRGDGATGPGCGDVWSSPAVDRARRLVFVGTGNCVTSPTGWGIASEAIVALDLDDGSIRWTFSPHEPNRDDLDFAGAPNLFEAGGRALVGLGNKDGVYYALDRDTGQLVWRTAVAAPGLNRPGSNFSTGGFIAPTAVSDGIVAGGTAIGGPPFLHALDAATGVVVWQQPEAAATYGAPAVSGGVLVVGGTDFTLRALDLRTGTVLWSEEVSGAVSGGPVVVGDDVIAVAGIREPGQRTHSRSSGVYRFSVRGRAVASTSTSTAPAGPASTPPRPAPAGQRCVGTPCAVPFDLIRPPPGTSPTMTLLVRTDPWRVEARASGLGPPSAWVRAGSAAARSGASRYGLFASESDDDPEGGLLCVLDETGSCTSTTIPRAGATYNRITLLAIADSPALPSAAEGVNRLVTTIAFDPPLAPAR